jgi:hypothetical protein
MPNLAGSARTGTDRLRRTLKPKLSSREREVAMRGIAMTYAIVAALALCSSAALAQNNAGQPGSSGSAQTTGQADPGTGQATGVRQAPVGHRQPSAKDVPPRNEDNLGVRSPEDQAVDRKLRICRDC